MRKYKFRLGLCAIPSFISKPSLIAETLKRYKATKGESDEKYLPDGGARWEYWTWDAEHQDSASSAAMANIYLKILYTLGVKHLHLDVDIVNKKVWMFHKINKADIKEQIKLSDGRDRYLMSYDLEKKFGTQKK